jgi:hypothetical protein
LLKSLNKDISIELQLNGRYFEYEAHIVRKDIINNLYGVKFTQAVDIIDDYLASLNIHPHYGLNMPLASSVWLDLVPA